MIIKLSLPKKNTLPSFFNTWYLVMWIHFLTFFWYVIELANEGKSEKKTWKIISAFDHLSQVITDKLRRKIMRKLVGKLNIISKYSTSFGHTSRAWIDVIFNFYLGLCNRGRGGEIQGDSGRWKCSTHYCQKRLALRRKR